jgi:hypothetical protein
MNNAKDIKKDNKIRKKDANNTQNNLIIQENCEIREGNRDGEGNLNGEGNREGNRNGDEEIMKGLCGNKEIYSSIISWLRDFNYKKKISTDSCIIVTGKTCVGKTYSINKICNYLNYEIININNNNCFNSEQLNDVIFKSATSSLLQVLTGNIRNKVIVIDNFDCIYISDKTINTTLLKILTDGKIKNIPIICISNNEIIKKIGDIKKNCKIYDIAVPTKEEVIENINNMSGHSKKQLGHLYDLSNGNMQKIFCDVQRNSDEILYEEHVENDCDINILYLNIFDRNQVIRIINKDPWMIPLKFHENIIIELDNRKISLKNKIEYYKNFIEIMCLYDYYMFKNNNEACITIFASNVYYLSLFKYKKGAVSNIGKFTKMLSYLSLQKKNIKQTYKCNNFPLYQVSNYHINLCNRKFISFK